MDPSDIPTAGSLWRMVDDLGRHRVHIVIGYMDHHAMVRHCRLGSEEAAYTRLEEFLARFIRLVIPPNDIWIERARRNTEALVQVGLMSGPSDRPWGPHSHRVHRRGPDGGRLTPMGVEEFLDAYEPAGLTARLDTPEGLRMVTSALHIFPPRTLWQRIAHGDPTGTDKA